MKASIVIFGSVFTVAIAGAAPVKSVNSAWAELQKSPAKVLNKQPRKFDSEGRAVREPLFDRGSISRRTFVDAKAALRREKFGRRSSPSFFAGNTTRKKTLDFFDPAEFRGLGLEPLLRLQQIEAKKLTSKKVETQPWSGSYWPLYQGGIASRFASSGFNRVSREWRSSYDYVLGNSLADVMKRNDPVEIDQLSPAEKYDLLIGEPVAESPSKYGFLTPKIWMDSERHANANGSVETWMGLCHGWASASLFDPRPVRIVEAPIASDSRRISFYPDELKGLTTHLWAEADYQTEFVGGRCNKKNPKVDPATGRVIDPECFDVNPAVWHLIVVNQIGQLERGLVIDATYDYEVWNQPVYSFEYDYFNPETGVKSTTLAEATIAMSDFGKDKFKKFRDPRAVSVVGVEMSIEYTVETSARQDSSDSVADDNTRRVTYNYDVELDANGEAIGGEWYSNSHPDFLWVAKRGVRPTTSGDTSLPSGATYDPAQPIPRFWRGLAVRTAEVEGQPLAIVVEALLGAAAQ